MKAIAWFRKQKIQYKIIIIYVPLVLIPLLLLSFFSYKINTDAVIAQTKKNMRDESGLITTRIDAILGAAESFANNAMLDLNKEAGLKLQDGAPKPMTQIPINPDYIIRNQIEMKLDIAKLIFPEVESAVFVDRSYNVYVTDHRLVAGSIEGFSSPMFEAVAASNGLPIWFSMEKREFWSLAPEEPVLTAGKKIYDTESLDLLGYLFVNINEKTLSSVYAPVGPVQSNGYYITDNRGMIISSSRSEQILQPVLSDSELADRSDQFLRSTMHFDKMDWTLVNEIPLMELTKQTRKVSSVILIAAGICLLLALLGAIILSKAIASPIISLAKHINRIRDENIDRPVQVRSSDEIGILGAGLNMMLGRVNDLLIRIKEEQQQKREYELALIQEQIKPHFFYNTLDLIYVLCKSGESIEASRAVKALADYYRVSLSNGKEIISIREEIRNVNSYLYIQKARYPDMFTFSVHIQNELLNGSIPKLTLQPLIENAIYHGLKENETAGHISVTGVMHQQIIQLKITDDGLGIAPQKLAGLLQGDNNEDSFGLHSVHERIKLYFGDQYGVTITSRQGEGTTVLLEFPMIGETPYV